MELDNFKKTKFSKNISYDLRNMPYPSILRCFESGKKIYTDEYSTHYGFVLSGTAKIEVKDRTYNIYEKGFFSFSENIKISGEAKVTIMTRIGYNGMELIGGPIGNYGRFNYIDSCSTSILIPPHRVGDPGLHQLIFPPNIKQSSHVHPSKRFGIVTRGSGYCILPNKKISLEVNDIFYINRGMEHCFHSKSEGLEVIAYHPDSNTGPTDDTHQMKSATYLVN